MDISIEDNKNYIELEGGRGHWTVNYTGTLSFRKIDLLSVDFKTLGTFEKS